MAEPTFDQLKQQVRTAVDRYEGDEQCKAAMLSGMSLAANFLAKLDGSATMRPATVLRAVTEVGLDMGFEITRLD